MSWNSFIDGNMFLHKYTANNFGFYGSREQISSYQTLE